MKRALFAAIAMFGAVLSPATGLETFRYERALTTPDASSGQACAVLDATVFAHAASQSLEDLRVIRTDHAGHAVEVPFNLSINDTQTTENDLVPAENLRGTAGTLDFDLKMPQRPHSSITLDLVAKDFMGTADVSGRMTPDGPATNLGTFPVFDLSSQHLARSTTLALEETSFPWLHGHLRLNSKDGSTKFLSANIVRGAIVPPSREAQRLYSTVATTTGFHREGPDTVATLHLPGHVPAERVSFTVAPTYRSNFQRNIEIVAIPDGASPGNGETVAGAISRVDLAPSSAEPMPIDSQETSIETAFAANFHSGATIRVRIHDGNQVPLPLTAVSVEMRQRKVCFDTTPAARYILLYGAKDDSAEDEAPEPALQLASHPAIAQMGPELPNPLYAASRPRRSIFERQPDLLWTCSAAVLAILGSVALRRRRVRRS